MANTATENTLPVFLITRKGVAITDDGVEFIRDLALGDYPELSPEERSAIKAKLPENTTGVLVHTGPDLLDAGNLADLLEKTPNARLMMSYGDSVTSLTGEDGTLAPFVEDLRNADDGIDSWTILDVSRRDETTGG